MQIVNVDTTKLQTSISVKLQTLDHPGKWKEPEHDLKLPSRDKLV